MTKSDHIFHEICGGLIITRCLLQVSPVSPHAENNWHVTFYAPQLVPAGTAEARISYGNSVRLSVRLSVCHNPVVYQAQVR